MKWIHLKLSRIREQIGITIMALSNALVLGCSGKRHFEEIMKRIANRIKYYAR